MIQVIKTEGDYEQFLNHFYMNRNLDILDQWFAYKRLTKAPGIFFNPTQIGSAIHFFNTPLFIAYFEQSKILTAA